MVIPGKSKTPDPFVLGLLAIACMMSARGLPVMGQQPSQATDQAEKKTAEPAGLATLSDDVLWTELADRRLGDLLSRAMDQSRVPEKKRQGIVALLTLRNLAEGLPTNLSDVDRRAMLAQVAGLIDAALPEIDDARLLQLEATALIAQAVNPDLNTLEYWGDSPQLQASLLPMAEGVDRILARAQEICTARMERLAGKIASPDDEFAQRYTQDDRLRTLVSYTRAMSAYAMVLSLDQASDRRKDICTSTINALKDFDTSDSTVQVLVRMQMAKLMMARGGPGDTEAALGIFNGIINLKTQPSPTTQQVYEAMYFSLQGRLRAGDIQGAAAGLEELARWQRDQIPAGNDRWSTGANAAMNMLQYRVFMARAGVAADESSRQQFRQAAIEKLGDLLRSQPALRPIIQRQLVSSLPANAPLADQDALMLDALVDQAIQETRKGKDASGDLVNRGLNAATELLGRKDLTGIDPPRLLAIARARGVLLEQSGKALDATDVYLDDAAQHADVPEGKDSLNRAMRILSGMQAKIASDVQVRDRFIRMLELAVAKPYSRLDLAYLMGRTLQQKGDYQKAIDAYALVPADSAEAPAGRYFTIIALGQWMDSAGQEMATEVRDRNIQAVEKAAELAGNATARPDNSPGSSPSADAISPGEYDARSLIAAADLLLRHGNNPQRSLKLLDGIESRISRLDAEGVLLGQSLQVRVNAFMSLKQNMQATQSLVKLLETRKSGEGSRTIYDLLQRLEKDLDDARLAGNMADQRSIAMARATLSEYLVKWAVGNPDQTIRQHAYQYRLYDADAQNQAAMLVKESTQRKDLLAKSLAGYQLLATPELVAEYHKIRPADDGTAGSGSGGVESGVNGSAGDAHSTEVDPHVLMGMACVMFDQGDYRQAQPILGRLLLGGKLGGPRIVNGNDIIDNEPYWEGTLKLYRCNIALAKVDPQYAGALEETKSGLARLYIRDGQSVGGKRWQAEFQKLRLEILPEMKLPVEGDNPARDR